MSEEKVLQPEKLEAPRKIMFVISALNPDNGQIDKNTYVPGLSLGVGQFRRSYPLKSNITGTKYVTGFELDEIYYDDSIPEGMKDEYQKDVRTARKWLERIYGSLDAERTDFWGRKKIVIDDLDKIYLTEKDEDLILYYNIMGGGYPEIARNYDDAVKFGKQLYLSVAEDEAKRKTSHRANLLKAKALLQDVFNKWSIEDTLYLCYYLTPTAKHGYTKNTPKDYIIGEIDDYIDGVDTKTEKKRRPTEFIEAVASFKTDKDRVRVEGLFNAALYYGYIIYKSKEKEYVNKSTGFPYGSLKKDAVEKLLNPQNIEELSWLKKKIEQEKWVK